MYSWSYLHAIKIFLWSLTCFINRNRYEEYSSHSQSLEYLFLHLLLSDLSPNLLTSLFPAFYYLFYNLFFKLLERIFQFSNPIFAWVWMLETNFFEWLLSGGKNINFRVFKFGSLINIFIYYDRVLKFYSPLKARINYPDRADFYPLPHVISSFEVRIFFSILLFCKILGPIVADIYSFLY